MSDHTRDAWEQLFTQCELTVALLLYNAMMMAFWTGVYVTGASLINSGHAAIAYGFLAGWLLVSAPVIAIQVRTFFYWLPRMGVNQTEPVPALIDVGPMSGTTPLERLLGGVISASSPFAACSVGALYHLVPVARPFDLFALETKRDISALAMAIDRLTRGA